jgi:CRP-like cAMP-binding protein
LFLDHTAEELELVQSLKRREHRLGAAETLIHEGQTDAPLYTLLQGWAFRYKTLSDGRRQILSFLLAGYFIGVQQKMGDAAAHGVDTVTETVFCASSVMRCWNCTGARRPWASTSPGSGRTRNRWSTTPCSRSGGAAPRSALRCC